MPQVDLSSWNIANQSDLFNKDINGKVNPEGQTLGKTASTVTSVVIPIPLANEKVLGVMGKVADGAMTRMGGAARKVEQFGQEAAAGMRGFGQPEFASANRAPVSGIRDVSNVKGSNVLESRAFPEYPDLQLPVNKGTWTGEGGNSGWVSDKPAVTRITEGEAVPFKDGFPEFSKWSKGDVEIEGMIGDHYYDFKKADEAFAKQKGWKNADGTWDVSQAKKFRESSGSTWHHHQNMTTMQLVPASINNKIPHTGGASLVKIAENGVNQ
jgi:hypothetical protein